MIKQIKNILKSPLFWIYVALSLALYGFSLLGFIAFLQFEDSVGWGITYVVTLLLGFGTCAYGVYFFLFKHGNVIYLKEDEYKKLQELIDNPPEPSDELIKMMKGGK